MPAYSTHRTAGIGPRSGTRILAITDDAYFGLFYEPETFTQSLFARFCGLDEHVLAATLYVLVNPVRARLCHHPSEWTWGSYRDAVELRPTLVPTAPLLERLAPDPRVARARLAELVDEQVARIAEEGRRETVRAGR